MAYNQAHNDNLLLKFDPDLKGSVDFDFFGANTPRNNGSNNNAISDLNKTSPKSSSIYDISTPVSSSHSRITDTITKQRTPIGDTICLEKCSLSPTECQTTPSQPPNSPHPCDNFAAESINIPDTENYDYSSDDSDASSSYCSSLSKSESLPQSDNESENNDQSSHHHDSHRSNSTECSASSFTKYDDEDDSRPRSPSPTPREIREPSSSCSRESQNSFQNLEKTAKCKKISKSQSQTNSPIKKKTDTVKKPAKTNSHSVSNLTSLNFKNPHELVGSYSSSSSDVTDVSPLSTNGSTSPVSLSSTNRMKDGEDESSMITSDYPRGNDDRLSVNVIMRALMEFERDKHKSMIPRPESQASSRQKNLSFSSERCRDIDAENQRLLNSLLQKTTVKSKEPMVNSGSRDSKRESSQPKQLVYKRPYHSALNRQKQQRKIEEENKRILQRIQSVRATPSLVKQNQFRDYMKVASMGGSNIHDLNSCRIKGKSPQRGHSLRPQSSLSMRTSTRRSKEPIITDRTKEGSLRRCHSASSLERYDEANLMSPKTVMSAQPKEHLVYYKPGSKPLTAWSAKTSEPHRPNSTMGHPPASPSRASKKASKSVWPAGW